MLIASPFYSYLYLLCYVSLYGRISPYIPLSSPLFHIPPIIPPFPFSPVFPPVPPFWAASRGFPGLFGLFRWSWSGPGGAGSVGGYTCLLAAVPESVRASSAALLVLLGGPCAVLPAVLPFCACSGSGDPLFRACLFRARELGRIGNKKRSGGACSASSLRACILFSGCKGQDDYCGADQAINRCSHIFPVSVK